jgi:diguanylate cyclase (GGDEF)-like protein/PAS domain S-box-containing protein
MQPVDPLRDHVSLIRSIAEASHDPLVVFDAGRQVALCNAAALRLIGSSADEVVGQPLCRVLAGIDCRDCPHAAGGRCLHAARPAASADPGATPGNVGSPWTLHPLHSSCGALTGGFCTHQASRWSEDVERQLRHSERRFRDFVECASDWFWETDRDLCYSYLSERYQDATGLPPESRLGHRRGDFRLAGPDDGDWLSHLADLEARRPFRDFAFAFLDAGGARRVAKVSGRPVFDDNGAFSGYRGVGRDITAEVEAEKQIRFLAQHDPLTGLPNRSLLKDRLNQVVATARRMRRKLAVHCIDLDDFKIVNDTLGHAAGDALLRETARRMRENCREMDTVARLGGDEFTVVQAETHAWEDAQTLARRLIQVLSEPIEICGEQIYCGASIGISLFPDDGTEADELLRRADLALYKAKAGGRNNFCFFLPSMNDEVRERRAIEDDLREAMKRNGLQLHYQPQIDLSTGRLIGLEALLRWQHPTRGLVPPSTFVPIAERSGLILKIDRWVLREACAQAKRWLDEGLNAGRVAVNLSALQLARPDLVDQLAATLAETQLAPDQLEIEITESVLLTDTDAVAQTLAAVHRMGVRLAVDDFGTGYSSLTYLRRFPVQKVKIDQSFVRNLNTDADNASIARAIISLGHSLGLQVVAEGVETREQINYLRNAGCDQAQGYFIAKPMSAAACGTFLVSAQHPGRAVAGERHGFAPQAVPNGACRDGWPASPRGGAAPELAHRRAGRTMFTVVPPE